MFHKYKYVLAVYQEKSFTKAANKLFISQPSLSVAIRNIEKEIGAPLFERYEKEIKPTEIGEAYITAAQKMQQVSNEFERKLAEINGLKTGKLEVGGSNYLVSDILPKIISRFCDRFPGVEIVLTEANSVNLRKMLRDEEVDIVIDNFENFPDLYDMYPLINEQIMICVPGNSEINKSLESFQIMPDSIYGCTTSTEHILPVDISTFKDEGFILLKNGNDMHDRAMNILGESGIAPNVVFSVEQLNTSFTLTESGLGTCFVTDTFFKYRKHMADVVLYKLKHQLASRTLHIAHKKGRYCTKAMSEFIKITQEMIVDSY